VIAVAFEAAPEIPVTARA
jgi:hypothetical protein